MSDNIKMVSKGKYDKCEKGGDCGAGGNGCSKAPNNESFLVGDSANNCKFTSDTVYTIGGVKVQFPVKAYPSQMAMMAQIVKGCHRRQNCLLESPTGSGKSLALLCSTLGWQQAEIEKANRYNNLLSQGITDADILARAAGFTNGAELEASFSINEGGNIRDRNEIHTSEAKKTTVVESNDSTFMALNALRNNNSTTILDDGNAGGFIPADEDDDFVAPNPRLRKANVLPDASQATIEELQSMDVTLNNLNGDAPNMLNQQNEPRRLRIPKIFFGTRTHKQITQIVKELKRTKYRDAKTAVLGSREHTCIHPVVSKSKNKNEGCRQLLDPNEGSGCRYKNNVNRVKTHELIQPYGIDGAWDIEDMVQLGKKKNFCPYFTARELMASAEIIFCPYNYLVDPMIRDAMMINLKEQVVILDEAHNIEDSAREAASTKLEQEGLIEAKTDLEKLSQADFKSYHCDELAKLLSSLSGWIVDNSENLNDYTEFDRSGKIFSGTEMIAILDNMGYSESKLEEIKGSFKTLVEENDNEDENGLSIGSNTKQILNGLLMVCHFLFKDNMKYRDDYKVALVKTQERKKAKNDGTWFSRARRATVNWTFSINFWCLNPAVSFHEVGEMVRSIILTSGTLSPMNSFQSELGVPFPIKLEANHVIQKNQVFISSFSTGPTNQTLQATYRFTETWSFQDELGRLVLSICMAVPHGVLCFLPSYSLLDKLVDRWRSTGLWDEISKYKFPLCEPRRGDEFQEAISTFYDTIRGTKDAGEGEVNGSFLMAVCRGKVSEGMDFTDDNARAVIAVGIPFPNFKDIQVDLKKKYNDLHCRSRGLLTGSAWYEIQAYRALNQALGRCIRHKYDWGALLLVDERYQRGNLQGKGQNKYIMGLSKWVRGNVRQNANCVNVLSNLKQFAIEMKTNPPKKPELVNLKKEECSKFSENNLNNEVMNNKDSIDSDVMFKKPFPSVKSDRAYSSESQDISNISQVEGLSNTIVADMNSIKEDGDDFFLSPTSLVIPSGKPNFTSTQIGGPSYTSTQINSSIGNDSENAKGSTFITSTQRESAKNSLSSNIDCKKKENDIYEFQFLDTQKDNKKVSPLKVLIENEIREKNMGNTNSVHKSKKHLNLSTNEIKFELNESKSNNRNNTSSPDLFDEDPFDESPVKVEDRIESTKDKTGKSPLKSLSWNSNGPPSNLKGKEIGLWYANRYKHKSKNKSYSKKRKSYGDDTPNLNMNESQKQNIMNFFATFGGGEAEGTWKESKSKEKYDSPSCKKLKQNTELETPQIKSNLNNDDIAEYDSDLDDFNLDKSYSTPLTRRVVDGKRRSFNFKRKGVVFEEYDD